jgi:hypothetical protein
MTVAESAGVGWVEERDPRVDFAAPLPFLQNVLINPFTPKVVSDNHQETCS